MTMTLEEAIEHLNDKTMIKKRILEEMGGISDGVLRSRILKAGYEYNHFLNIYELKEKAPNELRETMNTKDKLEVALATAPRKKETGNVITFGEYFKRREQGETVTAIAKSLGVSNKSINRRLEEAGYKAENKVWIWQGEGEEPLEEEMVFSTTGQPLRKKGVSQQSNYTENKPTNKPIKQEENKLLKKVTYEIEEHLHDELKIMAVRQKRKVSEIVNELIKRGLDQ